MKKIIWGIVAGLLVLAVIALITVATFLDGIVKKGVETVGPKITGVTIKLDEMHIGLLTGAKVHVSLTMLGGKEMTLTLPEIHLTNLGRGGDGLTATDLTRAVFQSITSATIKAVADAAANVGGDVKNLGGKGINKLKSGLGGLLGK